MVHRQHSSWKKASKQGKRSWPTDALEQQAESQRRLAEGIHRPAPSLNPPSQENAWVDEQIAAQKAAEEAADQARAERLAARGQDTPEEPNP